MNRLEREGGSDETGFLRLPVATRVRVVPLSSTDLFGSDVLLLLPLPVAPEALFDLGLGVGFYPWWDR